MSGKAFSLIALLMLLAGSAVAEFEQADARLRELVPSGEYTIRSSAVPGMLEVRIGTLIVYMSEDGRYLFQGSLQDLETRQDLTSRAQAAVRKEDLLPRLDAEQLITFGEASLPHSVTVFTDVTCFYCIRLHNQIEEYNEAGIQVRYAAFPRAGAESNVSKVMDQVWCADDRNEAMTIAKQTFSENRSLMSNPPEALDQLPGADCETPVAAMYELGQQLGVSGTPAIITADGHLIPGAVPPPQLRMQLDDFAAE